MPDVAFDAVRRGGLRLVRLREIDPLGRSRRHQPLGACWAGLIAIADQLRASQGLTSLDGPTQTLPALYGLPAADFHDITSGNNGYPAGPATTCAQALARPWPTSWCPAWRAFSASIGSRDRDSSTQSAGYFGQSVTFTATVLAPPGTGTPTGTVTFRDGSLILGTAPLGSDGQASFSTPH